MTKQPTKSLLTEQSKGGTDENHRKGIEGWTKHPLGA